MAYALAHAFSDEQLRNLDPDTVAAAVSTLGSSVLQKGFRPRQKNGEGTAPSECQAFRAGRGRAGGADNPTATHDADFTVRQSSTASTEPSAATAST